MGRLRHVWVTTGQPRSPAPGNSDNRITVTGTDASGKDSAQFGKGPCGINCNNLQGDVSSFHANAVFANGSVRFLKSSINISVLVALVAKDGGGGLSDF